MCGKPSKTRRCKSCQLKQQEYIKNSKYIQAKKAKQGIYGIKQIWEII